MGLHFDSGNNEWKDVTMWDANSCRANQDQYLGVMTYHTQKSVRNTPDEHSTHFNSFEELQQAAHGLPDARYLMVRQTQGDTPQTVTIHTSALPHQRSGTHAKEPHPGRDRDAVLISYHPSDSIKPFLGPKELSAASHLTPAQAFVLGGFAHDPQGLVSALKAQAAELNAQWRIALKNHDCANLDEITLATFRNGAVQAIDPERWQKQESTYDKLKRLEDTLPRLQPFSDDLQGDLKRLVTNLKDLDQNDKFNPPILLMRTYIRERKKAQLLAPINRDFALLGLQRLLSTEQLREVAGKLRDFYKQHGARLQVQAPAHRLNALFTSGAALANDYVDQLVTRVRSDEGHQVKVLFLYYMLDDLDQASVELHANGVDVDKAQLSALHTDRLQLLQHFLTHRLMSDHFQA